MLCVIKLHVLIQDKGPRTPDGNSHILTTHKDAINLCVSASICYFAMLFPPCTMECCKAAGHRNLQCM